MPLGLSSGTRRVRSRPCAVDAETMLTTRLAKPVLSTFSALVNGPSKGNEGSTAQSEYLDSLGCHIMQGFLFSRPVAVNDFLGAVTKQQAISSSLSKA